MIFEGTSWAKTRARGSARRAVAVPRLDSAIRIAIITGAFGLLGIAVGRLIETHGLLALEQKRIEGELIIRAIVTEGKPEDAQQQSLRNLTFLKTIGLLADPSDRIELLRRNPASIPSSSFRRFLSPATVSPDQLKRVHDKIIEDLRNG